MLIEEITEDFLGSYLHLERYVNKGSPSGFSFRYSTTPRYRPKVGDSSFGLPCILMPKDDPLIIGDVTQSSITEKIITKKDILFPIHPDMLSIFNDILNSDRGYKNIFDAFEVVPLANARTVMVIDGQSPFFVKLHYEGVIGRVFRSLPIQKVVAGIEISEELDRYVESSLRPLSFAYLKQPFGLCKKTNHKAIPEIGVVFREASPSPNKSDRFLIPFFALFSQDDKYPNHPLLLTQILSNSSEPHTDFIKWFVIPILECYKFLAFDLGLIPEINAQNVLLEIDKNAIPHRIVFRDMQGFTKDLKIRRENKLHQNFVSFPYKCIDCRDEDSRKDYYIRHSFLYDFKLTEYIFDELFEVMKRDFGVDIKKLRSDTAELFRSITQGKEVDYFQPYDKWYSHPKVMLTHERPYICIDNPKCRKVEKNVQSI